MIIPNVGGLLTQKYGIVALSTKRGTCRSCYWSLLAIDGSKFCTLTKQSKRCANRRPVGGWERIHVTDTYLIGLSEVLMPLCGNIHHCSVPQNGEDLHLR